MTSMPPGGARLLPPLLLLAGIVGCGDPTTEGDAGAPREDAAALLDAGPALDAAAPPDASPDDAAAPVDASLRDGGATDACEAAGTLRACGAVGDGVTDDTAALRVAIDRVPPGTCIDGEGLRYLTTERLDVFRDFCLRDATLHQRKPRVDLARFIGSSATLATATPPAPDAPPQFLDADMRIDDDAEHAAVLDALNNRVLLVRGSDARLVSLELTRVTLINDADPASGSRIDSAALWVDHASPVRIEDLEITGGGRGAGAFLADCADVVMDGVWVHDLVWGRYAGAVSAADLAAREQWANAPIYEYDATARRFYLARVQEQIAGVLVSRSRDVILRHLRVERLHALFGPETLPWQTDGVTVAETTGLTLEDSQIEGTFEGIDLTGRAGVRDFRLSRISIRDSFAFGVKVWWTSANGVIEQLRTFRSGWAGVVIGDRAANVTLTDLDLQETGVVMGAYGPLRPWSELGTPPPTAGVYVWGVSTGTPMEVHVRRSRSVNALFPGAVDYGFYSNGPAGPSITASDVSSIGHRVDGADGFGAPP